MSLILTLMAPIGPTENLKSLKDETQDVRVHLKALH